MPHKIIIHTQDYPFAQNHDLTKLKTALSAKKTKQHQLADLLAEHNKKICDTESHRRL